MAWMAARPFTGAPGNWGAAAPPPGYLSTCWPGSREDHTVRPPARSHTSAHRHTHHRPATPNSRPAAGLGLAKHVCVCE